jgi:enamine deaminase RidA (YjgF/YER057c/UK114 family)
MEMKRINYSSGAPLEEKAGYSRMIKTGPFVFIGGTTAVLPDGSVFGENSVYEQTRFILTKFVALLEEAGAHPRDVIKIKAYLTDMSLAPDAAIKFKGL